jgi:hypothetical protein
MVGRILAQSTAILKTNNKHKRLGQNTPAVYLLYFFLTTYYCFESTVLMNGSNMCAVEKETTTKRRLRNINLVENTQAIFAPLNSCK